MKYAVDLVIFGIDSQKTNNCRYLPYKSLSVLLVKRQHDPYNEMWCLPGGFVKDDENSLQAVSRILLKETNLENVYLNHFGVFDDVDRDPRCRVVSNSFMALIDKSKIDANLDENAKWFNIDISEKDNKLIISLESDEERLKLLLKKDILYLTTDEILYEEETTSIAFDHSLILAYAINTLKDKVKNTDIVFNLMPSEFTIGELKQVYELLLNKKLVSSAFRRVISNKIEPTDTIIKTGGFRPSTLYKYKQKTL